MTDATAPLADTTDPFERRLEDDPKMVRVVEYLKRIEGFRVVSTAVAPHCGVLYVFFTTAQMHNHIGVGEDDGHVVYQWSIGNTFEYKLEVLARHFGE